MQSKSQMVDTAASQAKSKQKRTGAQGDAKDSEGPDKLQVLNEEFAQAIIFKINELREQGKNG